ncbi:SufS family cysteine desulfurase [Alkalibaculum sp. M08DMB]|uniref:cysteine desulfurase n=1 Tax=Alkalibaculum sporogenes TaxID=2655001 RepID=A0A6A7K8N4_9FIRM|nr:cysteine desulfurase [Alkalibaculum sporogenes]MPW25869.1 SufS family cysteine desulfurase [Alkalibaculum sporogenes]
MITTNYNEGTIKLKSNDYYFLPEYRSSKYTKKINGPYGNQELDINLIRKDFPILQKRVNGKPLVWLDNSATTQKPNCVIKAIDNYYSEYNSNIHRGAHTLAKIATEAYEGAREKIRSFINADSCEEIIFVRGTTEAINLVAETFGDDKIQKEDEIIISVMEHHSNIVPWQKLAQKKGAIIKVVPIDDCGEIIMEEYAKLLTSRTKIVAITHLSNVLGTINPIKKMIEMAHHIDVPVLIDGAQSIPHIGVNVKELDADFFVFSGHKIYAPTGIGVLYGKKAILEEMTPWQRGGGMIKDVNFETTTYNDLPYKFEAGTGNIADAIGLGEAIAYINNIGIERVQLHEKKLTSYAMDQLSQIPSIRLIGTSSNKSSVLSYILEGVTPEDVAKFLNNDGIAVRAGHHCAQPVLKRYGLNSAVRASIGIYNTIEEINALVGSTLKIARY